MIYFKNHTSLNDKFQIHHATCFFHMISFAECINVTITLHLMFPHILDYSISKAVLLHKYNSLFKEKRKMKKKTAKLPKLSPTETLQTEYTKKFWRGQKERLEKLFLSSLMLEILFFIQKFLM